MRIKERDKVGKIEDKLGIFLLISLIILMLLSIHLVPSVCRQLTPPSPPKVTEIILILTTTNSTTVSISTNANITVIAAVKDWKGNLSKPKGFAIEFEIEEAKVKGEVGEVETGGRYHLTKSIAQTDDKGKAYTNLNLNLELVNETAPVEPVEVVVKASWHKGYSEGVSVSKSVNVTSADGSEAKKVPVMSLYGVVLLAALLCLAAVYSISRGKGMRRKK